MSLGTILLVDDETIILETMGDDLREAGYEVVLAHNGLEAMERFESNRFDMVISDMMMDEMNGFEILKEIKKKSPETPVVIITGFPSSKTAKEALLLGASEIIIKPSRMDTLMRTLERHRSNFPCR